MKRLSLLLLIFVSYFSYGQCIKEVTIEADKFRDACFHYIPGDTEGIEKNHGDSKNLCVSCWTWGGIQGEETFLIDFDLSSIPKDAIIISATLHLTKNNSIDYYVNYTRPLELKISKVTQQWKENKVTWNTRPKISNTDFITVKEKDGFSDIDITQFVQDKITNPHKNYGLYIETKEKDPYQGTAFGSSENPEPSLRPSLTISYTTDKNFAENAAYFLLVYDQSNRIVLQKQIYNLNSYVKAIKGLDQGRYLCILLKNNKVVLSTEVVNK